jgi:hypothetical protein
VPRRIIVDESDCEICRRQLSTSIDDVFISGYITGKKAISKGDEANIGLCEKHEQMLANAIKLYVSNGVKRALEKVRKK